MVQRQGFARDRLGPGQRGFHRKPQTGLQDAIELSALFVRQRIRRQFGQFLAQRQEGRDIRRQIVPLEVGNKPIDHPTDLSAAGHAIPSRIDPVHDPGGRSVARK